MKGIVLAGGSGTRLHPVTRGISKQLLPVYDKPMIYYPIAVLMLAGINDVLIITNPNYIQNYKTLLGDGSRFGISLSYQEQVKPNGLAEAFILGDKFIADDSVALILGDNLFYGQGFSLQLEAARVKREAECGATLFGYKVANPSDFGVATLDNKGKVTDLKEKPNNPISNCAVTGLYLYDNAVVEIAKSITPSARGELEITDINKKYLAQGQLEMHVLGRGLAWLDTGTHESLLEAGSFVQIIEKRQGHKIACLEEIGWRKGWITDSELVAIANQYGKSSYSSYVLNLVAP